MSQVFIGSKRQEWGVPKSPLGPEPISGAIDNDGFVTPKRCTKRKLVIPTHRRSMPIENIFACLSIDDYDQVPYTPFLDDEDLDLAWDRKQYAKSKKAKKDKMKSDKVAPLTPAPRDKKLFNSTIIEVKKRRKKRPRRRTRRIPIPTVNATESSVQDSQPRYRGIGKSVRDTLQNGGDVGQYFDSRHNNQVREAALRRQQRKENYEHSARVKEKTEVPLSLDEPLVPSDPLTLWDTFAKQFIGTANVENVMMIGDVVSCIYNLSHTTSRLHFVSEIYMCMRTISRHASLSLARRIVDKVYTQYIKSQNSCQAISDDSPASDTSFWKSLSNGLSALWSGHNSWIHSPMADSCIDLLNALVYMGLVKDETINILEHKDYNVFSLKFKRSIENIGDVCRICMKSSIMLCDIMANFCIDGVMDLTGWASGNSRDMFVTYAALMAEASDARLGQLDSPNRDGKFRSPVEYDNALNKVIEKSTQLMKQAKPYEKVQFTNMLKQCMTIKGDITAYRRCTAARVKPYTFSVYGTTSQIKSTVAHSVWKQIAAANGISDADSNFCTVNFKDEYFSEVQQQEVLLLDDFMNERAEVLKGINPIRILLDWSSNVPVQLPAAAIEDKGKRYCNAKILGLTCHSQRFHAETMSYQPDAAYRRVNIYIQTVLRPEYKTSLGQPDYNKIPNGTDDFCPNIWNFSLYVCKITGDSYSFEPYNPAKLVYTNDELMDVLIEDSQRHYAIQRSIVSRLRAGSAWICEHGRVKGACRSCRTVQGTETNVPTSPEAPDPPKPPPKLAETIDALINEAGSKVDAAHIWTTAQDFIMGQPTQQDAYNEIAFIVGVYQEAQDKMKQQDGHQTPIWAVIEYMRERGGDKMDPYELKSVDVDKKNDLFDASEPDKNEVNAGEHVWSRDWSDHRQMYKDAFARPLSLTRSVQQFFLRRVLEQNRRNLPWGFWTVSHYWIFTFFGLFKYLLTIFVFTPLVLSFFYDTAKSLRRFVRDLWSLKGNFMQLRLYFAFCTLNVFFEARKHPLFHIADAAEQLIDHMLGEERVYQIWLAYQTTASGRMCVMLEQQFENARKKVAEKIDNTSQYFTGRKTAFSAMRTRRPSPPPSVPTWENKRVFGRPTVCRMIMGDRVKTYQRIKFSANWALAGAALYGAYKLFSVILANWRDWSSIGYTGKQLIEMQQVHQFDPTVKEEIASEDRPCIIGDEFHDMIFKGRRKEVPPERLQKMIEEHNNFLKWATAEEADYEDYQKISTEVHGADVGVVVPLPGEYKDAWVKSAPPETFLCHVAKTSAREVLPRKLRANLCWAEVHYLRRGAPKKCASHALAIGGNDWIVPTHCIPEGMSSYEFLAFVAEDSTYGPHTKGSFLPEHVQEIFGTDFSVVRVSATIPRVSLLEYFPIKEATGVFSRLCYFDEKQQYHVSRNVSLPHSAPTDVKKDGIHYKTLQVCYSLNYPVETFSGLCGAVWLGSPDGTPFIHSLHICGTVGTYFGGSTVLTRGMIAKALEQLDNVEVRAPVAVDVPHIQGRQLSPNIPHKHFLNFIPTDKHTAILDVLGSMEGISGKLKQDIFPSAIADMLEQRLGWEHRLGPVPHPNSSRHLWNAMKEFAHPRNNFDPMILKVASMDYKVHVLRFVHTIPALETQVLPLVDTAIVSGLDNVVGIGMIDPKTSAGCPEGGKKGRFYVDGDPSIAVSQPFNYDEHHLAIVRDMEETMARGERVFAPFRLSLKVEPIKKTKEHGRIFGASNMCFTFLFRKYYISIFRLIQLYPFQFETALGINCHSEDWNQLAEMMKYPDRLIEGDYQTYDKTMGSPIILAAFGVLIDIARMAGYNDRQIKIMWGIAFEVAFPTYEGRQVVFVAAGSNPSGHPGTFIINCIVNSIYMRYAFYLSKDMSCINDDRSFAELVSLVTAGDDHLASVHPDCTWFNQHTVQYALSTIDVGYTDGKKNPVFESAFTRMGEASFVSRGFRYCDHLKRVVGPLVPKSLQKAYMIHNMDKGSPFSADEILATNVATNEIELFLCGKEYFNKCYPVIRQCMEDAQLGHALTLQRSWEDVGHEIYTRTRGAYSPNHFRQPHHALVTNNPVIDAELQGLRDVVVKISSGGMGLPPEHRNRPASNSTSNNGMTSSANVVHDNPSALSWTSSRMSKPDASREIYSGELDGLATYLERPVVAAVIDWQIATFVWNQVPLLAKILQSTPIRYKTNHFANISFELEVDITVSSNPFLYGQLLVSWQPFSLNDNVTQDRAGIYADNVSASQRQRLFIDASSSSGGKMIIPFYWPTEYFSLLKDDPTAFGQLSVRTMNLLSHVSGANQVATVYIRTRMINVKLHTPTFNENFVYGTLSVQADESPTDTLSSKATRVADIAASLTPVLGGYAIATEKAARASAAVLRAMGLSHPTSKEMVHKFENRPIGNMSNYNYPSSATKLALDINNEVTIDPSVADLMEDEMSFAHILGKETFVGTITWNVTAPEGTQLAQVLVNPSQWFKPSGTSEYHLSTVAYLSRLFQFWTGTLRFRFQVVCSKWHRGKIRLVHDPVYTFPVTTLLDDITWQTNAQAIMDITEERDITVDVHWCQGHRWAKTLPIKGNIDGLLNLGDGVNFSDTQVKESNGVLSLVVMNRLVVPDDTVTAPCYINMFVSAGPDFQLAVPNPVIDDMSFYSGGRRALTTSTPVTRGASEMHVAIAGTAKATGLNNTLEPQFSAASGTMILPHHFVPGNTATINLAIQRLSGTGTTTFTVNAAPADGAASAIYTFTTNGTQSNNLNITHPTKAGVGNLTLTIAQSSPTDVFTINSVTLHTPTGTKWKSARIAATGNLVADGQQDVTSVAGPPNYTLYGTGAPTMQWQVGGSSNLYNPGNYGQPIYVLGYSSTPGVYTGHLINGIYPSASNLISPFTTGGGTLTAMFAVPITPTGVGTFSYNKINLFGCNSTGANVAGARLYDVTFLVPDPTVQADEQDAVANPANSTPDIHMHETSIPDNTAFTYMGEKVMHLRQILGRPVYICSAFPTSPTNNNINQAVWTFPNLPLTQGELSTLVTVATPFTFMLACYNGWRGSTRMKYVFNGGPAYVPCYAKLARLPIGNPGYSQATFSYSGSGADLSSLTQSRTSNWGGATVSNPQLANEISAEFPYYARHRFKDARTRAVSGAPTVCDAHTISAETSFNVGSVSYYMDQYFQPGEDFTLLNWVGTPILY